MYAGIGFLFAALIAVGVIPLVHDRAVRLTTRKLETSLPLSMGEIQADKDLLRAEFAMSTRRLEMLIEQLKSTNANRLVELGKLNDAVNRLKSERAALRAEVNALKTQVVALKERDTAASPPIRAEGDVVSYVREWIPHRIHH